MAYEVIINKRFTIKLLNILEYIEKEFGTKVAQDFLSRVRTRIYALKSHPYIGSLTSLKNARSTSVTKHNRLYYRIARNKIIILNLYDTRSKKYGKLVS
jgi:plasmid stabilization system protein ParE